MNGGIIQLNEMPLESKTTLGKKIKEWGNDTISTLGLLDQVACNRF